MLDEARQLLERHAADQQQLEAVGEAHDEGPIEARVAVQLVPEPKAPAEGELAPRRAHIAEPAGAARAVDDRLDAGQQPLEDRARHRAIAEMLEQQLALLIGEREQAERDAIAIGDLGIEGVLVGRLGDPLLVRAEHVGGGHRPDAIAGRRGADRVAHAAERQRQHLVAQRLVERRQPVELQQMHDRAQRGAVDEQREQHEAGRQDRDEALDLGVDQAVLGHAERERERDRAAHRAPGDHEFVAMADPLREACGAEQRQQAEQDQGAGDERDERDDADQQDVVEAGADHQARHQDRRQDEHQRAGPERQLLPDVVQERPVLRRQPLAPLGVDHEARRDHGGHARDFEIALAQDIHDVRQGQRQGRLGEPRIAQPRHQHHQAAAAEEADQRAAEEGGRGRSGRPRRAEPPGR